MERELRASTDCNRRQLRARANGGMGLSCSPRFLMFQSVGVCAFCVHVREDVVPAGSNTYTQTRTEKEAGMRGSVSECGQANHRERNVSTAGRQQKVVLVMRGCISGWKESDRVNTEDCSRSQSIPF